MGNISLELAEAIILAAKQRAKRIGVPMNIVVVDSGGNLKALECMDGARPNYVDVAIWNARALLFADADVPAIQGGVPLISAEGQFLGAIGVSGGGVHQDQDVAKEGAEVFEKFVGRIAA